MANDPYLSLRIPEYRAFLASMGAVFMGTQIQSAVLGWQVYALTGDTLSLGLVAAVSSFFIGSSNELGAFESGLAARLLGVVPSVVFGGAMTLFTVGFIAWRAPALRRLEHIGPSPVGFAPPSDRPAATRRRPR